MRVEKRPAGRPAPIILEIIGACSQRNYSEIIGLKMAATPIFFCYFYFSCTNAVTEDSYCSRCYCITASLTFIMWKKFFENINNAFVRIK